METLKERVIVLVFTKSKPKQKQKQSLERYRERGEGCVWIAVDGVVKVRKVEERMDSTISTPP